MSRPTLSKLLKTPKEIIRDKASTYTAIDFMKWQITRLQEVIDEDMSHAGPEKYSSYNLDSLRYRMNAIKFFNNNLKELDV